MLSEAGEVKLLDLGLARLLFTDDDPTELAENANSKNLTATGQAMGTADYIAPEQVTDSRGVDARADLYSLGCTLFKLLTGVAPFADDRYQTAFSKLTAHVSAEPPKLDKMLPELPESLVRLVGQMLSKHPADRPATALLIADQLSAHCSGSDLPALAERAEKLSPVKAAPRVSTIRPQTQSLLRRRVSVPAAIGAAFFSMLIGFLLGIIITIQYPDGTTARIEVPDGAEISLAVGPQQPLDQPIGIAGPAEQTGPNYRLIIENHEILFVSISGVWEEPIPVALTDDGMMHLPLLEPILASGLTAEEAEQKVTAAYKENTELNMQDVKVNISLQRTKPVAIEEALNNTSTLNSDILQPLQFAIVASGYSEKELSDAVSKETAETADDPIQTSIGTLYARISDDVTGPIEEISGRKFVVTSNRPEDVVTWEELRKNLDMNVHQGIRFDFRGPLAERMQFVIKPQPGTILGFNCRRRRGRDSSHLLES